MPLRRPVKTLKQLCLKLIVSNLSDFTTDKLRNIPVGLSEELLQYFKDVNRQPTELDCRNRNRLIRPDMKNLNVDCYDREGDMNVILSVCENLTSMRCNFHYSKLNTRVDFNRFIPFIQNVTVLELRDPNGPFPKPGDDLLEAIGDNCLQLEILILYGLFTDDGVRRLCQSKSGGYKIKHLDLHCNLTEKGCLIVLTNLKQLKVFKVRNHRFVGYELIIAFQILFEDFVLRGSPIPTFQLCQLPEVRMQTIKKGTLEFMIKCCPNVSNYQLNFMQHANELSDVIVKGYEYCPECVYLETFLIEISSRNDIGAKITSLVLRLNINLETILMANLPNLRELTLMGLDNVPIRPEPIDKNPNAFTMLQYLNIIGLSDISQLKFILKNCLHLEKFLCHSNRLTDDELMIILQEINPLRHLTHFHVKVNCKISKKSIYELLVCENNLKEIQITYCSKITVSDRVEIESFIKKNNYNVLVKHSPVIKYVKYYWESI